MKVARLRVATIAEVARRAKVSPATVSRVMNSRFLGSPEVAARVRQAAEELNYTPSPLARSLALGETRTVGFIVPDLTNPTFQAMLASLSKSAAADGYRVLVADSTEDLEEEAALAVQTRRACDGLVLCAPRLPDDRLARLLAELWPALLINRASPSPPGAVPVLPAPSLSVDYAIGIQHVADHLYDLGHRHLAYLEGPSSSTSNRLRLAGLQAFAERVGDVRVDRIATGSSAENGCDQAAAVRECGATGVLAYNDLVAVGLLNGLGRLGVSVPGHVSVAGFDDIPLVRYLTPGLTTASVQYGPLGAQAWQRLLAVMKGERSSHDVLFAPRLTVRESTAPPPSAGAAALSPAPAVKS